MANRKEIKKSGKIPQQLRRAIQDSGLSLNELRRRCGVDHGVLSRFMNHERDMTLEVASRVCECLGLVLANDQGLVPDEPRPVEKRKREVGKLFAEPESGEGMRKRPSKREA